MVVAAACGLRAFLPLLALGLSARAGVLPLAAHARWLGDDAALVALGVATVVELLGDKIPAVDHVLDLIGTALRPPAAAVAAYAVLSPLPEPWSALVALGLGGGALGLHAIKAKARVGSSIATLGVANPVLSLVEDGLVLGLVVTAIVAPLLALAALLLVVWAVRRLRLRRRRRAAA